MNRRTPNLREGGRTLHNPSKEGGPAVARLPKTPIPATLYANGQETPPRGVSLWRSLLLPAIVGSYRLLNVVHTGHASLIWQAYDDAKQRIVGVKTLLEKDAKDREQLHYLRWEYTVGLKLQHPNIIQIYPSLWDAYQPHFAMEWFASPNMKQRFLQSSEKMAPLLPKIIDQACEALAYLHGMGWVHRDIKPDNLLVTDDGEVKLIDFALAKRCRHGLTQWLTPKSRLIQGTKSYISPEQIRGQALDGRADLYSLACSIHEILSGKPPFTGTSETTCSISICDRRPPLWRH